jgi:hypothetical protein
MTTKNDFVERRKHKRLKVKENIFAVLSSDNKKLGQIKDISEGGLTFQYIENNKPAEGLVEIDIFSPTNDFYLKNIPVEIIKDTEVDNSVPFSSVPMKQFRIQFGKMTPTQLELLGYLLQHYTLE